jgi:heat shock protein HtpX
MLRQLYSFKNYAAVVAHYAGAFAVGVGAVMLGQPWALAAGAALSVGVMSAIFKLNREILENHLKEHPKVHKHSPKLGEMVEELYKRSGLSHENSPVYDFQIKDREPGDRHTKTGKLRNALRKQFGNISLIPNAAAFRVGKPVIIISEPLLKMLDDEEEKAVLAHEFAHAAAHHIKLSIPQKTILMGARISNTLTVLATAISAGWGFIAGIGASIVAGGIIKSTHPNGHLIDEKPSDLALPDIHKRKQVSTLRNTFANVAGAGTITVYAPYYLPIYAASLGMALSAGLITKSFSRANEYQADEGAVTLGASPLALITSLRKITSLMERSRADAWGHNEMPKPGMLSKTWKKANATHPQLKDRIDALCKIARKQGYSGDEITQACEGPVEIENVDNIPLSTIEMMAARFHG